MPKCAESDIVKIRDVEGTCYIITHLVNFWDTGETGYKLLKIYPVSDEIEFVTVAEREVDIVARDGKFEYKVIVSYLNDEYREAGFQSFIHFVKKALLTTYTTINKTKNRGSAKRKTNTRAKNNNNFTPKQITDTIFYHEINSIDECLDALNDLKVLHEIFDDESYLQLRELVLKRLEKLSKKKKG